MNTNHNDTDENKGNQSSNFSKKINRINQLIIIGNGYDLHLHDIDNSKSKYTSRFIDFIKYKYSYFYKYIQNILKKSKINKVQKKRVILIKILNLIFSSSVNYGLENVNLRDFSDNIDKIKNKLDNFNFWVIYLLIVKFLSNFKSPCWYNIEDHLTVFLNTSKHSFNEINNINNSNIYDTLCKIIGIGKYTVKTSLSISDSDLNYNNSYYNLYVLLLLYFILLDDKYLRKELSEKYFGKYNKEGIAEHLGNMSRKLATDDSLSVKKYEQLNPEESFKDKLYFYLKTEMSDFDMSFNDYLVEQMIKNKNYNRISYKFLFNMVNDLLHPYLNSYSGGPFFSFLNFNYTNPLDYTSDMGYHFSKSQYIRRNIHGLLTSKYLNYVRNQSIKKSFEDKYNILNKFKDQYNAHKVFNHTLFHLWCYKHCSNTPVIGIDGTGISTRSLKYIFTKTYGIMRRVKDYNERGLLAPNIKYIKFFGHSLGKADYSYFESIFDKYHIYSNNSIMLIFYYNCYKDSNTGKPISDAKASLNQLHNVSKLFDDYCYNKSITTNELLSSLILNGRLIIRNIDAIKKFDK